MGNDPVNMTDPSGGSIFSGLDLGEQVVVGAMAGFFVGMGAAALTGNDEDAWRWASYGAIIGGGIPLLGSINLGGGIASTRNEILKRLLASNSYTVTQAGYNPGADGIRDAIINAILLGAPAMADQLLRVNPLSRYSTEYDKQVYTDSRFKADIAISVIAIGISGGADAAADGALVIALAGSETLVVGGVALEAAGVAKILSVYSKGVSAVALADAGVTTAKMARYRKRSAGKGSYVKDYRTKNTKDYSSYYKSEREARNLARQKLGKNPVEVEPYKWRSADGKWQYRAKPGDVKDRHIHIEELNPQTGEILQNYHLRW